VPFKVITDHNPLVHLQTQANLTRKQARWSQYLQQFEFEWEYRPGRTNVADPLSRVPETLAKLDAITLKTLTERVARSKAGALREPEHRDDPEVANRPSKRRGVQKGMEKRPVAVPALEAPPADAGQPVIDLLSQMQQGYLTDPWFSKEQHLKSAGLHQRDGLWLTRDGQVAIPDAPGLRRGILHELHDAPASGHPGGEKTFQAVKKLYWWPKMAAEIKEYVRTCASCQRNKPVNQKPIGVLHPLPIPGDKWESVSMDFITQLPKTNGPIQYDAIVVFVDRLSKMVHIAPTTSDVTAEGAAQLLHDNVFRHHGVPTSLITDRGAVFTSHMFAEFMKLMGTTRNRTTAYHPQSDGQTERTNQTLETMLRHYVGSRAHGDWDTCLAAAEFAINLLTPQPSGRLPSFSTMERSPDSPSPSRPPECQRRKSGQIA